MCWDSLGTMMVNNITYILLESLEGKRISYNQLPSFCFKYVLLNKFPLCPELLLRDAKVNKYITVLINEIREVLVPNFHTCATSNRRLFNVLTNVWSQTINKILPIKSLNIETKIVSYFCEFYLIIMNLVQHRAPALIVCLINKEEKQKQLFVINDIEKSFDKTW